MSLQIAFLVAFSQLVPAHTVTLFRGFISLRVPRFPLIYIALITTLAFTPLLTSASFILSTLGFITSWTYLRFYKNQFPDLDSSQPSSLHGDASETFAFAEFFPSPLKTPVAAISDQVYNLFVALRICTPFSVQDVAVSRGDSYQLRSTPGSTRAETERRRALALKALDQRLNAATASVPARPQSQPPAPSVSQVSQPLPGTQTEMTTQTRSMLGETNYEPDREEGGGN